MNKKNTPKARQLTLADGGHALLVLVGLCQCHSLRVDMHAP